MKESRKLLPHTTDHEIMNFFHVQKFISNSKLEENYLRITGRYDENYMKHVVTE